MITMSHNVERSKLIETVLLLLLNAYIHSGNDCSSAYDIQKRILHNAGPNNVKVSVVDRN